MKTSRIAFLCCAAFVLGSLGAAAGFDTAFDEAQGFFRFMAESPAPPPVQGKVLTQSVQNGPLITFSMLSTLPAPDPRTAAWLASRIPGLNTGALKTVPESSVEAILARASVARATYLDIFTDAGLGRGKADLFYLSQGVLDGLNRNYVSGTLPVNGVAKDGHPYHMQALVAGNGVVTILYDLTQFDFKDAGQDYRIVDAGRVTVTALGPADVGVAGVKAHGCRGPFCAWVDIQRITKTGPTSAKVKHSKGDFNATLQPVHRR